MTTIDLGPLATALLAQASQPPAAGPAPEASQAPATQAPSQGFTVPGATGTSGITQAPGSPTPPTGGGQVAPTFNPIFLLLIAFAAIMILPALTGRKEKKRREELLSSLKRGDRVQTTAGIIGTIADLSDNEITLRVDEASNTRIRFSRAAVQSVVREGKESGQSSVEVKPKNAAPTTT